MAERVPTNAIPCAGCRYLTEPAVGHSKIIGSIEATLSSDGSIMVRRANPCGAGTYRKLERGVIENHSMTTAKDIERCTGPFTDTVYEPRKLLGFLGLKKKVEVTQCGSLYDGDIIKIAENAMLHPAGANK